MKSSPRIQALAAGIALLIMAFSAAFSYGYVYSNIAVEGDPAATFELLTAREALFKISLGGWLLIFLTDLLVSFSLYLFFRETRKHVSLATALARLVYTVVLGIAITRLFSILPLLDHQGIELDLAGRQVLSILDSFGSIWSLGLIIFGLHLLGLGYLSLRSPRIPGLLAYLLLFAGLAYMLIHSLQNFTGLSDELVAMLEKILMAPMALAEILLAFWLIIRGGKRR